jgi:hypothetical protein
MAGRLVGVFFVTLSMVFLGYDLVRWIQFDKLDFTSIGTMWFHMHPSSLQAVQTFVEIKLFPVLWDPIMTSFLHFYTWLMFFVIGVFFLLIFRHKSKKA